MSDADEPKGLRERQHQATRDAIVEAYLALGRTENTASISIPAVAERSGVSVRTIYRYFPTKTALADEAAAAWGRRVRDRSLGDAAVSAGNFADYLGALWKEFDAALPSVLAEHSTPVGRELRRSRLAAARAAVAGALPPAAAADDDLVDLLVAVTSSSMYIELAERMGHDAAHATRLAVRAVESLLAAATNDTEDPT